MTLPEFETALSDLLETATDDGLDISDILNALEQAMAELEGDEKRREEADVEGLAADADDATDP